MRRSGRESQPWLDDELARRVIGKCGSDAWVRARSRPGVCSRGGTLAPRVQLNAGVRVQVVPLWVRPRTVRRRRLRAAARWCSHLSFFVTPR
jgi:hypothetical protein